MSADRLQAELVALGRELELPETPDIATGVLARIEARRAPAGRTVARRRTVLVALALLVPTAVALAVSGNLRDRVRDWLGVDAVVVEEVETLPPVDTGTTEGRAGATRASFERRAATVVEPVPGERVPLVVARRAADFPIRTATGVGRPAVVFLAGTAEQARVSIVWRPRPGLPRIAGTRWGLLVTQLRGDLAGAILKQTVNGTSRRFLSVSGRNAFALVGAPHTVTFTAFDGEVRRERTRLAVNTLLVSDGGILLRVEANAPVETLARVAASVLANR